MLTMQTLMLASACLVNAGDEHQIPPGHVHQRLTDQSHQQEPTGLSTFAQLLLAMNPDAAFRLASNSARLGQVSARSGGVFMNALDEDMLKKLEYEPYSDRSTMPDGTWRPKSPYEGKIVSVERIVGPKATGEICNIVVDHDGKMPYVEGQSYGVMPSGTNPKNNKPHKARLYSIASTRYGDDLTGTTTTFCVRRATYWDDELGREDPAKKGVCSNFLCDAQCGDIVKLTGPVGKVLLMPEETPEKDIIMVATGTGIAPFRGFLRRLFVENTPYAKDFQGLAWLFLGVANSDALLYDKDWQAIQKDYPNHFRYSVALSREQKNKDGEKMYIQDRVEEYADEVFDRLDKGAHIYFCGLKGMMPGIQSMLEKVAISKGLDYEEWLKNLKSKKQWHCEVYR